MSRLFNIKYLFVILYWNFKGCRYSLVGEYFLSMYKVLDLVVSIIRKKILKVV